MNNLYNCLVSFSWQRRQEPKNQRNYFDSPFKISTSSFFSSTLVPLATPFSSCVVSVPLTPFVVAPFCSVCSAWTLLLLLLN